MKPKQLFNHLKLSWLLCCVLIASIAQAQFQTSYSYPGIDNDHYSIVEDQNNPGNFITAGTQYGTGIETIQVLSVDAVGAVNWEFNYSAGTNSRAFHIEALSGGGYAITGYNQGGLGNEVLLLILNPLGGIVSQNRYSIPGYGHVQGLHVLETQSDMIPGYVIGGFACNSLGDSDPKTGFTMKIDGNTMNTQWVSLFDTPVSGYGVDFDMVSHVLEVPNIGYFTTGSVNGNSYQEVAAIMFDYNGLTMWSHQYEDNGGGGHYCVGASALYDGNKIYQLSNLSVIHHFGVMVFDPSTGVVDLTASWRAFSNFGYYNIQGFKILPSINSSNLVIAGYMRDHYWDVYDEGGNVIGQESGSVPFMMEVDKAGTTIFWDQLYQVPSPGYNVSSDIFSAFSAGQQPRIHHPEMALLKSDNQGYVLNAYRSDQNPSPGFDIELIETDAVGVNNCVSEPAGLIFANTGWFFESTLQFQQILANASNPGLNLIPTNAQVKSCEGCNIDGDFSYVVSQGNCSVQLNANGADSECYDWDFGDGSTGSGPSTTHIYASSGTYTICLTTCCVSPDGTLTTQVTCHTITVQCGCDIIPDFQYTVNGCTVDFQDLSQPNSACYEWDFGDGNVDNTNNPSPSHTYASAGTYTVCLTVCCVNLDGTLNYQTICKTVTVDGCCDVIPAWDEWIQGCTYTWSANNLGTTPLADVCFEWTLPDGSVSNNGTVSYTFDDCGFYDLQLSIWCCNDPSTVVTVIATLWIEDCCCDMTPDFAWTANMCDVQFNDLSTGDPTSCYHWDFGDGSFDNTGNPNPVHTYASSGAYTVCLTICCEKPDGTIEYFTICKDIQVDCAPCVPDATFNINYTTYVDANGNCWLDFNTILNTYDTDPDVPGDCDRWIIYDVIGNVIAILDGTTYGNGWDISYTLPADCYVICREECCVNSDGTVTTTIECIEICGDCPCEVPQFDIDVIDLTMNGDCEMGFCITTLLDPTKYCATWDWGDGIVENHPVDICPIHIYACDGIYNVCVTVYCCDDPSSGITVCRTIDVDCPCNLPANIDFAVATGPTVGDCSANVTLNLPPDVCPDEVCWSWDFGDGSPIIVGNPTYTHTYAASGSYLICLKVWCCDDPSINYTLCYEVEVVCPCDVPQFDFDAIDLTMNGDCEMGFCLTTSLDPTQYCATWDFGDGSIENHPVDICPVHIYTCDGVYEVCVTVYCCDDPTSGITVCKTIDVNCPCNLPDLDFTAVTAVDAAGNCTTTIDVLATITPCPNDYCWSIDLGDGSPLVTGSPLSVTHVYPADGVYTVCIYVFCCDDPSVGYVICKDIVVNCDPCPQPCEVFPTFQSNSTGCTVDFYNFSSAGAFTTIDSYFWDFGDGGTSGATSPSHTFPGTGTYTVCLTVQGHSATSNCSDTFCWDVYVDCEIPCPADINGDGTINIADLIAILLLYGTNCP